MPPQGESQKAARPQPKRETLSEDEVEFVRSLVVYEDAAAIVVNKPPGLATQGGTKTRDHLDRLLGKIGHAQARIPPVLARPPAPDTLLG